MSDEHPTARERAQRVIKAPGWRTRGLRILTRVASWQRLRRWHDRGLLKPLDPVLRRGGVRIPFGAAQGLCLSGRHFEPWGGQAFAVLRGIHELQVQEALRRALSPGSVFFDVGANIGFHSLVAARLVGPDGAVVALDPEAHNVEAVLEAARHSGFDNVTAIQAAAAAGSGEAEIHFVRDSLWTRLASVGDHDMRERTARVRAVALDDLVRSGDAPLPDVIKIDVEGGELEVLAGMTWLLAQRRPVVICEMHGKNAAFCELMRAAGYRISNLDGPDPVEDAHDDVHALAVPQERL